MTDRFGIIRTATPVLLLLIASTYVLFETASGPMAHPGGSNLLVLIYAVAGLGAGAIVITPILMTRSFPTAVRFTGVSFSYNLGYALFGGITPMLVSLLVHLDRIAPAYYVAVVAVVGLGATILAPRSVNIGAPFRPADPVGATEQ